jgi:hypothetical protein
MSKKWLCLAILALLWACLAGCTLFPGQQNPGVIAATPEPVQPAGIQTPLLARSPVVRTALPVENSSLDLTPSLKTGEPDLKEASLQTQTETVASARKDLAQRLGISVGEISILSVINQEYSSDAFYCRTTKGRIAKNETALLISGETILLQAHGIHYEYHANDPLVFYCRQLP